MLGFVGSSFRGADRMPPMQVLMGRWMSGLVVLTLAGACRTPAPSAVPLGTLEVPIEMRAEVAAFAGSPLGGPRSSKLGINAERVLGVEVTWQYVDGEWADLLGQTEQPHGFEPLASGVDLVIAEERRHEIQPAARLFDGAMLGQGELAETKWLEIVGGEACRSCVALEHQGVLLAGATSSFEISVDEVVEDSDNFLGEYPNRAAFHKSVGLRLSLGDEPGSLDWMLGVGSAAARLDAKDLLSPEEARFRPGGPAPLREWVRPARIVDATKPVIVLLSLPFSVGEGRSLAMRIRTFDVSDEDVEAEVAAVLSAVEQSLFKTKQETGFGERLTSTERTVRTGLDSLRYADDLRAVFAYLTGVVEPPLAADFVLVGSREQLAVLAERVAAQRVLGSPEDGRPFDVRWCLERETWSLLAAIVLEGGQPTPGETSLLLRHGGEVGRFATLIEEALEASQDCEAFAARLASENMVFLSDANPAARVRAFDWLVERDLAPSGFDPLGGRSERRRALERVQ